jgi:aspartate/methionine/tyrosine aminotransferase
MPAISRRTADLGTENAFVVLAEVTALVRQGRDIISFCIGQPDFATPTHIQDAAIRAIREGKHGYTPSAGIDELREAAADYMGRLRGLAIKPEEVVVGAGAKPFIAYSILATTDYGVGDEVIYPNPGFPIYESQIKAHGAVPVPLHLREARNFAFDPAELEAKLTPRTRLLILNSPHNPTGGILARRDLEDIAAMFSRSARVRMPPVGLCGELRISSRVRGVSFASSSAGSNAKLRVSRRCSGTGTAPCALIWDS